MSSYKELIELFSPGFKQGALDVWVRAKYVRSHNLYPFFFGEACVLCGRKPDYLYGFTELASVYFHYTGYGWISEELGVMLEQGQSVMDVCEQHGGPIGLTVMDCRTGEPVYFKPRRWHYPALNLTQGFILHTSIALRWLWFYLAYLYGWLIGWRIAYWRKHGRN